MPKTGVICCGTAETVKCCGLVVGEEEEVGEGEGVCEVDEDVEGLEVGGDERDDEGD